MGRFDRRNFLGFVGVLLLLATSQHLAIGDDRAEWMKHARWGVMTHYLADWLAAAEPGGVMTVARWNQLVDGFDVARLAGQLHDAGAGYLILTLGQNSGYYLAPNATYDRLVGTAPSRCARRDLVADLAAALQKRGIRLIVYLPAGAPARDRQACQALQWRDGAHRNREFQLSWEQVIREWSLRWGDRVAGWWFDGCYWPNTMYRTDEAPNFASFAAAARAGNAESIVAFNPGVVDRILSVTPDEDFTAGEVNLLDRLMIRRAQDGKADGAQIHVLSYLGSTWGKGTPRFSPDEAASWTRKVVRSGGAMTWDVPIGADGGLYPAFLETLGALPRR